MMNAKEELLECLNGEKPLCAAIEYAPFSMEENTIHTTISLKRWYSQQDWEEFLNKLDFTYDDGYGTQELFGTVWLENHMWLERDEYDGSEWWIHNMYPEIPEGLL